MRNVYVLDVRFRSCLDDQLIFWDSFVQIGFVAVDNLANREDAAIYFDYQALTSAQRQIVQQKTGEIRDRLKRSAQDIWEIGQRLAEVRSQLKHGQFEKWLKDEFGWSRRTAYNFISVYEAFQESVNFAQIDIATSALYLLAAPSTPQTIRNEVLERAQKGEKIAYKDLHRVIKSEKIMTEHSSSDTPVRALKQEHPSKAESSDVEDKHSKSVTKAPEIIAVISKPSEQIEEPLLQTSQLLKSQKVCLGPGGKMFPGWYHLGAQHLLFCGDTASCEFFARIPHARLVLAITSDDWDHDWIVEKADSVLILREASLEEISLKQLILTFSRPGDVVVFPWLPDVEMLSVAHGLDRKIFAGDPDPIRCAQATAATRLSVVAIAS